MLVDVLESKNLHLDVLDHGTVDLVDVMPRLVPSEVIQNGFGSDYAIVQAARVSYGSGTKQKSTDIGLIRYLLRNDHTTPFEMVSFKFRIKMPIFVARQHMRHRTAKINEESARYSVMSEEFYLPEQAYGQSKDNKQCSELTPLTDLSVQTKWQEYLSESHKLYMKYKEMIGLGVSRETARMMLPINVYTTMYWKMDLHNLFHYLRLRMDPHAQKEIRVYADAIYELIKPIVPIACQAFQDYCVQSVKLSGLEITSMREGTELASGNSREREEYEMKLRKFGIIDN